MQSQSYVVALENFEGPLDLLLHLIERRELPVTDVSVSQVTGDYIAYIAALEKADTRELTWFLDIGTRLLSFKTRALGMAEVEEDEPGSLEDLTEQLRYLQAVRKAAMWLQARSGGYIERSERSDFWRSLPPANVSTQDLVRMFEQVKARHQTPPAPKHTVKITRIDIQQTIRSMVERLSTRTHIAQAVKHHTKRQTVAQMLALLELVRQDLWELIEVRGEAHVQPKAS